MRQSPRQGNLAYKENPTGRLNPLSNADTRSPHTEITAPMTLAEDTKGWRRSYEIDDSPAMSLTAS